MYMDNIEKIKRRPSKYIETFMIKNLSLVFSWMAKKIYPNSYICCVYIHQARK